MKHDTIGRNRTTPKKAEIDVKWRIGALALVLVLIGLVLMFMPVFVGFSAWGYWWVFGMLLTLPNHVVVMRDWIYRARIDGIIRNQAYIAMKERYGREEA